MQPNKFFAFPVVLTISFLSVLATFLITYSLSQDWWKASIATTFVAVYLIIIIFISRTIWLPEGQGKFRVRLATAGIATLTIVAYTGWQTVIQDLMSQYLNIPNLGEAVHPLIIFSFSALVILVINYFNRDNTGMGIHPESLDKDIPERDFNERLESVCKSLVDDLRSIDIKTNWSVHNFVPLEAEVEVQTDSGSKKKVTDLLKAIKSSKDRVFLVLGDPGSGKSVALRKLCQDLAKEVKKTKKIPIYINECV
ncbi:MAG: hypothetical protein ACK4TA_15485 [Saprospiraceae bacterium]